MQRKFVNEKEFWNSIHAAKDTANSKYDGWLDKYDLNMLGKENTILELGCGWGDDTQYLCTLDAKIISGDFSEQALSIINSRFPKVETVLMNIEDRLPFENASIECVVADLCLHYFSSSKTNEIVGEIARVMSGDALLLCRVNSKNDVNYKYQEGTEIEKDFYSTEQGRKRMFDIEAIKDMFSVFDVLATKEYELCKYFKPKIVWEIVCRKA